MNNTYTEMHNTIFDLFIKTSHTTKIHTPTQLPHHHSKKPPPLLPSLIPLHS
jgi:hypothetical protein